MPWRVLDFHYLRPPKLGLFDQMTPPRWFSFQTYVYMRLQWPFGQWDWFQPLRHQEPRTYDRRQPQPEMLSDGLRRAMYHVLRLH